MTSGRILSLDEHLVEARLLDVEHLAEHRQDGLVAAVATLLGGAAGGVALDDVQLALRRVALLAVGELPGRCDALERALADDEVARLARRLAGARRGERLLDDPPAVARVLLEVLDDPLGDGVLDGALDVGVAELRLRLTLELGIGELDADDRGQALPDVIARRGCSLLLRVPALARPVVERGVSAGAEAGDVGPAVDRVDVVREGEDVLGEAVVVLERDLDDGRALATARRRSVAG